MTGPRDRDRHPDMLRIRAQQVAFVLAPAPPGGGRGDHQAADHPALLTNRDADDRPRALRRQLGAGARRPVILDHRQRAGGDHPPAQTLADRRAMTPALSITGRPMPRDRHHPVGIAHITKPQRPAIAAQQPQRPIDHRLIDRRRRRALRHQILDARHRRHQRPVRHRRHAAHAVRLLAHTHSPRYIDTNPIPFIPQTPISAHTASAHDRPGVSDTTPRRARPSLRPRLDPAVRPRAAPSDTAQVNRRAGHARRMPPAHPLAPPAPRRRRCGPRCPRQTTPDPPPRISPTGGREPPPGLPVLMRPERRLSRDC